MKRQYKCVARYTLHLTETVHIVQTESKPSSDSVCLVDISCFRDWVSADAGSVPLLPTCSYWGWQLLLTIVTVTAVLCYSISKSGSISWVKIKLPAVFGVFILSFVTGVQQHLRPWKILLKGDRKSARIVVIRTWFFVVPCARRATSPWGLSSSGVKVRAEAAGGGDSRCGFGIRFVNSHLDLAVRIESRWNIVSNHLPLI